MRTLGNLLWVMFGGFEMAVVWFFAGCLWCISIIGIPIGMQCFKIAGLVLWPFKKEVVYDQTTSSISLLMNVLWLLLSGIWIALAQVGVGLLSCITIIGIPFGLQHFKYAKLALMPFSARVVSIYSAYS